MEKKLVKTVVSIMEENSASGVAIADKDGIPLHTTGQIPDMATLGALLVSDAQKMFPGATSGKKDSFPIITLHGSDGSKTTIANKHGETVCMHFKE